MAPQPPSTPPVTGSRADWILDRVIRALIGTLRLIPFKPRVKMMGWIMGGAVSRLVGYRTRAERNLELVFPQMPLPQRRALAQAACNNAGRTIIENYSSDDLAAHLADTELQGEGLAALQEATAQGRPVLLVTGHFGNHEVPRYLLHRAGFNVGGLYRPMRNAYFNQHYVETMSRVSGPLFEQGSKGTRGFVRHLKGGNPLVILFDVFDYSGAEVSFLGQPTFTALTVGELSLKLNALVIPFFGIRQPDGHSFRAVIETPVTGTTAVEITQAMSDRLDARIRATPEQWFWIHRRWKNLLS